MAKSVKVTLAVKVDIDNEYPPEDHAADIVSSATSLFCTENVKVLDIRVSDDIERDLDQA